MSFAVKKFLPRTLFGRSLLIVALPVILVQIITIFVFFDSHWGKITGRLAFAVAGEIAVIANAVEEDSSSKQIQDIAGWAGQNLELLISYEPEIALGDGTQSEHQIFHSYEISDSLSKAIESQVRRPYHITVDEFREKWIEVSIQLEGGVLHVSVPQRRLFSASIYLLLRWMVAASIVLLVIAVIFMRNQIRPIRRLAVVAERFGKGHDAPASFKPEGAREVRQAGQAFLDMQERIRRQVQQRTAMLAGVSHDLRTPLTRMKLQAAMLNESPDVAALRQDIDDMERMIDAYLDFARGEGGEQAVRTDVKEILERVIAGMKRQGVDVGLETSGELSIVLRPVAFERCLANIINNAAKYGGNIQIKAQQQDGHIIVIVDDDGPGVPPDKREEVFRPFYRIEESRNPATGGVGLGLPIAQDIVHSHGGEISLHDSPQGGLRVAVSLPI